MDRRIKFDGLFFVRLFWITILSSFLAWFIALLINPQGRQLDLFFLRMGDFWADATNTTGLVSGLDPYHNDAIGLENAAYPPLAYILFKGLASVSVIPEGRYLYYYHQPIWTFLFVTALIVILVFFVAICIKQFNTRLYFDGLMLGLSLCLSYPMLFTIERGNILILSTFAASIFFFYYDSGSIWKKEFAVFCLALASGLKLSPAVLGILLICRKDWKSVCKAFLYGFLLLILPFSFFKDGVQVNLLQMIDNVKLHFTYYTEFFGTGLIASYVKYGKIIMGEQFAINPTAYIILRIVKAEVSLLLFFGLFHLHEKWKLALNTTLILLILPSVSGVYCMLYMIPVTVLFLNSLVEDDRKIGIDRILIFLSLIMIFFPYRCSISDYLNFNLAVPILVVISSFYSMDALRNYYKKSNVIRN